MMGLIFILPICIYNNDFVPLWIYLGIAVVVWTILLMIHKTSKEGIF